MPVTMLELAFSQMRFFGLLARQDLPCCLTCALAEIREYLTEPENADAIGFVCFHRQDSEDRTNNGAFRLAFGTADRERFTDEQIGELVCKALGMYGLSHEWNGSRSQRILVRERFPRCPTPSAN